MSKCTFIIILIIFTAVISHGAEVAITIDDFNLSNSIGMEPLKRNSEILSVLKKNQIKAIGFVTTKYLNDPKALNAVKAWSSAGHIVGNHTENHWKYNDKTLHEFSADILVADKKLQQFPTFQKIFRFPYLKEGDSVEKRDGMRDFLKDNDYTNGHVSIDASDWYVNMRLIEKIKKGDKVDYEKYRDFYLKHMWDRSDYYSKLAQKTLGKDIKHTVLLHHNLTTALFLDDLIKMYKQKGWKVIYAEEAFKDGVYKRTPKNIPAGESILWAIAKEKGDSSLRYPAEDSIYEKDEMDRLGL
ncbi:polysaccharide deacetylase family protein [Bdellovibrio bacteriovorus]|uniref:polysaccharide deacetylase family protein n=1 Tax=Bdellovibrio bacteriovorus TaxID=959 RepID=UPI0020A5CDAA|nr:polysaccharide deacetylase family protein [Bdellovibrio bacteriovorus]